MLEQTAKNWRFTFFGEISLGNINVGRYGEKCYESCSCLVEYFVKLTSRNKQFNGSKLLLHSRTHIIIVATKVLQKEPKGNVHYFIIINEYYFIW